MSSHKQQRTFLFRIICMVMLVLIQFDAYGYEMVGHFRENVQPMYSLSAPESLAEGNQENASWSDPVYRTPSSTFRLFVKLSLSFLCFLTPLCLCTKTIRLHRVATVSLFSRISSVCLFYCLLLI